MHVGLNAHLLSFGDSYRGAGISRYIRQLLVQLRALDSGDRITAFLGDRRLPAELAPSNRFYPCISHLPTVNPLVRAVWEQFWAPVELAYRRLDVLHSLGYVQPVCCPVRSVITVHDLSFLRYPEGFNGLNLRYLRYFTRKSAWRADRIIAVSQSTKKDIVELLAVPPEKVHVVQHGVEDRFNRRDSSEVNDFRRAHHLPQRFILFCGTLEPRKNVDMLVESYALLRKRGIRSHKLVIAGAKGWRFDRIFEVVAKLGIKEDVVFPGYLPSVLQPLWYNAADLFVYPSRYEGFGFPVLEAMACGTPVIASASSSLPEVVGDAGVLLDRLDPTTLADAIQSVLADEELRRDLSNRGLVRARTFSWLRAARETLEVYRFS